jgi:hypothetical protein
MTRSLMAPARAMAPRAALALASLLPVASASAQEAMYTAAATMPSPGTLLVREQFHWYRYDDHPLDGSTRTDRFEFLSTAYIGLVRDLALNVDVPIEVTDRAFPPPGRDDSDASIPEVDLTFKWRFLRDDPGDIDTVRAALLFGASVNTEENFEVNPHLGVVFTKVWGRHGFNIESHFTLNTGGDPLDNYGGEGPDDALATNLAYLYRIFPAAYSSTSTGAWYLTIELNHLYETNGDSEARISPGVMFEGRQFGFEVMAQLPWYQDLDERPELEFGIGVGIRFLF